LNDDKNKNTTFLLTGSSFYPCGLSFSVYKDSPLNIVSMGIDVTVVDDKTAVVVMMNSILAESGTYYGYIVYGPGWRYQTEAVRLLNGDVNSSPSQGKLNVAGLVIGIVIAVVAVIIVIILITVFVVWRHNEIKKRMSETDGEKIGMEGVRYVIIIFFSFVCMLVGRDLLREMIVMMLK
jgi:hypothetical protein